MSSILRVSEKLLRLYEVVVKFLKKMPVVPFLVSHVRKIPVVRWDPIATYYGLRRHTRCRNLK